MIEVTGRIILVGFNEVVYTLIREFPLIQIQDSG